MDVLASPLFQSLTSRWRKLKTFVSHYFDPTFPLPLWRQGIHFGAEHHNMLTCRHLSPRALGELLTLLMWSMSENPEAKSSSKRADVKDTYHSLHCLMLILAWRSIAICFASSFVWLFWLDRQKKKILFIWFMDWFWYPRRNAYLRYFSHCWSFWCYTVIRNMPERINSFFWFGKELATLYQNTGSSSVGHDPQSGKIHFRCCLDLEA